MGYDETHLETCFRFLRTSPVRTGAAVCSPSSFLGNARKQSTQSSWTGKFEYSGVSASCFALEKRAQKTSKKTKMMHAGETAERGKERRRRI